VLLAAAGSAVAIPPADKPTARETIVAVRKKRLREVEVFARISIVLSPMLAE
jgi:hypothetical protein